MDLDGQMCIWVVNIKNTTPNPRKMDATSEVNISRVKLRDLALTSIVKNHARKNNPSEMDTRLRCGTMATGIGGS